jgi:hypothetical protein
MSRFHFGLCGLVIRLYFSLGTTLKSIREVIETPRTISNDGPAAEITITLLTYACVSGDRAPASTETCHS